MEKITSMIIMLHVTIFSLVNCSKNYMEDSDSEMARTNELKKSVLPAAVVQQIQFGGLTWNIKSGVGMGPGPNNWNPSNVYLDGEDRLHLQISYSETTGKWDCAEIISTTAQGFGTYEWEIEGNLDLHPDVVLGLFNYQVTRLEKKTAEIDIEIAKWGDAKEPNIVNYSVWPPKVIAGGYHWSINFPVTKAYSSTKHQFIWASKSVSFQSRNEKNEVFSSYRYAPSSPTKYIPQVAAPVHINFWVLGGKSATLTAPVEVIIKSFTKY